MSFNRVDFPDPLTPTRPVLPAPKAMSRPSKTGVPSGQLKDREVQVMEADMWASRLLEAIRGKRVSRHRGTTGRQDKGPAPSGRLDAEVARGAHTSGVSRGVSGPQRSNVLLRSTATEPLYTLRSGLRGCQRINVTPRPRSTKETSCPTVRSRSRPGSTCWP